MKKDKELANLMLYNVTAITFILSTAHYLLSAYYYSEVLFPRQTALRPKNNPGKI